MKQKEANIFLMLNSFDGGAGGHDIWFLVTACSLGGSLKIILSMKARGAVFK